MIKFGQAVEVQPDKGTATIRFSRPEACSKCGACGSLSQTGTITLQADCKVGEWVRVEMPEGRFLEATAITYVIPLVGLIAGIAAGWLLSGGTDGLTLVGALAGLALSAGVLFLIDKRISGRPEWTPRVTAVYDSLPTEEEIGCHGA